ncbi:unnamed protein product [Ascophyllum nodosum]
MAPGRARCRLDGEDLRQVMRREGPATAHRFHASLDLPKKTRLLPTPEQEQHLLQRLKHGLQRVFLRVDIGINLAAFLEQHRMIRGFSIGLSRPSGVKHRDTRNRETKLSFELYGRL